MPSLNVLSANPPGSTRTTPARLLRAYQHAQRLLLEGHVDPLPHDAGQLYLSPAHPQIYEANSWHLAASPPASSPQKLIADVTSLFSNQSLTLFCVVPNPDAPPTQTQPLVDHLLSLGYFTRSTHVLRLSALAPTPSPKNLSFLPARSARPWYQAVVEADATEGKAPDILKNWMLDILDHPSYEIFLAAENGQPLAKAGLLISSQIAVIEDLYVCPHARRRGVARFIMHRTLEHCARSGCTDVILGVEPSNLPAYQLYTSLGFQHTATDVRLYHPSTAAYFSAQS